MRAHGQSLNWNRQYVSAVCRLDLRSARQSGPRLLGRVVESDVYFEIARLLAVRGSFLRRRQSRRAENGLFSHIRHMSLKDLAWIGVDRNVRWLSNLYTGDVGLVHHYFRIYHSHVGDGQQKLPSAFWMPGTTFSPTFTGTNVTIPLMGAS